VGYNKKWTGLLTWCGESFLKNWTMTGSLTNCVLRWSYLWWWEQDLWQPRRERFCFLHKEKEMRGGGGVLLVITLISPTDSMMEISESNFVRNIDMSDLLTILTKEYLPNFFLFLNSTSNSLVFTVGDFSFNYYRWKH